jgi:hypothetical protein
MGKYIHAMGATKNNSNLKKGQINLNPFENQR